MFSRPLPKPWKCRQSYAFIMILKPVAPLPPTSEDMKMMTVLRISYDSDASRPLPKPWKWWLDDSEASCPAPTHFQNHENYEISMHVAWFRTHSPLPTDFQIHEHDNSPLNFLWFWRQPPPFRPLPKPWKLWNLYACRMILKPIAHSHRFQIHENNDSPMHFLWFCSQPPPPTHFQNYENDNSSMYFLWFWGQPPPSRPLPKPWK